MRVVIVGAGQIGRGLAFDLTKRKDNELVIIDSDEERCDMIASELDALVLQGDGTDPEILKKAQLAEAEALVALTGSDAINTVIAMLAHRFDVETIIVKLKDAHLRSACQEIGVRRIITPKISAVAEMVSVLYGFERLDFSSVERGGLQLVELDVGDASGEGLSEVGIPEGAHLVAVQREDQVLIPRENIKLQEGDNLVILVENEDILEEIKKNLHPS